MPPKRKITNTKDVRQHGAETKIRESVQLPLRSIIRNRRTEPEIRAYRSRSPHQFPQLEEDYAHLVLTMSIQFILANLMPLVTPSNHPLVVALMTQRLIF